MLNSDNNLDADESFHLALKYMNQGDQEAAILHLKNVLDDKPGHGQAMYLLGALHADLGMYERATEELTKAVEMVPEINAAHFQLGLLHAMSGDVDNAISAWEALKSRSDSDPYRIFASGLEKLCDDDFEGAAAKLKHGLSINSENDALNEDMARILAEINSTTSQTIGVDESPTSEAQSKESVSKMFLAAYQQDNDSDPN
ncbi:MAG: tetratricopeptide repeat protein [Pseudomonadota bacterium]